MEDGSPSRLIGVLTGHEVPFVVIDGHAVVFHGYLRATEDVDIVFKRTEESESKLLAALIEINAKWIGDDIDPATGIERTYAVSAGYVRANPLMMLLTDHGFLDIFDYIPGHPDASVDELFSTALDSGDVRMASLAWLRSMKQTSNRPQDRLDLENLPRAD